MGFADSVTLIGQHVSLMPLSQAHCAQLVDAVKDGELWTLWYTSIPAPDRMAAEIERLKPRVGRPNGVVYFWLAHLALTGFCAHPTAFLKRRSRSESD